MQIPPAWLTIVWHLRARSFESFVACFETVSIVSTLNLLLSILTLSPHFYLDTCSLEWVTPITGLLNSTGRRLKINHQQVLCQLLITTFYTCKWSRPITISFSPSSICWFSSEKKDYLSVFGDHTASSSLRRAREKITINEEEEEEHWRHFDSASKKPRPASKEIRDAVVASGCFEDVLKNCFIKR